MENWVKLRYDCSPYQMFVKLRSGADDDVKARNELLKEGDPFKFAIIKHGEQAFTVTREMTSRIAPPASASVEFTWSENEIIVTSSAVNRYSTAEREPLHARLTLTDDADCKLKIEAKGESRELSCWQFRKMVLEDLLFNLWPTKAVSTV